jgi:hypothetical protein
MCVIEGDTVRRARNDRGMAASWRILSLALLMGLLHFVSGCTDESSRATPPTAPATQAASRDPDVIDFGGLRDIRFGASLRQLTAAGVVAADDGAACGPRFTEIQEASPVFKGDELVLIWANPPLRTPEGIMVGSSLDEARQAYPSAISLTPPDGSTTFPGLLITGGDDQAYLLLYDPDRERVEKLIVGYERYAGQLFFNGFGSC